jgi:small subunit ribosomal protein S9
MKSQYFYGVGRRKSSSVRAKYFDSEKLELEVNGKSAQTYFTDYYYQILLGMLSNIGVKTGKIEFYAHGGGIMGQSEAARLALAKALALKDPELRSLLRQFGYLTTDIRKVLPKRSGLKKARKARQWVKR